MVSGSPAWNPQATLALVTASRMARSSASDSGPRSPTSAFGSIIPIRSGRGGRGPGKVAAERPRRRVGRRVGQVDEPAGDVQPDAGELDRVGVLGVVAGPDAGHAPPERPPGVDRLGRPLPDQARPAPYFGRSKLSGSGIPGRLHPGDEVGDDRVDLVDQVPVLASFL